MSRYEVGNARHIIEIDDGWRVLDVGSGQNPHPRANVLLEKFLDDHRHRSGAIVDKRDPRLVIGDATAMPFGDKEVDYVIASHIAEHVDDPAALCRELIRVAHAGYVETPGWLADMLLREEFHVWRVRRRGRGLEFQPVVRARPLGVFADLFYASLYATVDRAGHWTLKSKNPLVAHALGLLRRVLARAIRLPGICGLMYTKLEWSGEFPVWVGHREAPASRARTRGDARS